MAAYYGQAMLGQCRKLLFLFLIIQKCHLRKDTLSLRPESLTDGSMTMSMSKISICITNTLIYALEAGCPVNVHYGFHHYAQWGGTTNDPTIGKLPSGLSDFFKVFLAKGGDGSTATPWEEAANKIGNHLGSENFGFEIKLTKYTIQGYWQTIFEDNTGSALGILLAVSVGGFLIWNWPKAKIFMGDVGSTLLGFIAAVLAIYYQNTLQLSLVAMLILTAVFWFDATVTLIRRILNKEKLSEAHRKHAYQRIVQAGWSHQKTTLWSLGINCVGFGFAFLATQYMVFQEVLLVMYLGVLYLVLRYIDKQKPFEYSPKKKN